MTTEKRHVSVPVTMQWAPPRRQAWSRRAGAHGSCLGWAALQSQRSSTAVEAKHFILFALWVITGKTAIRPVDHTRTVAERILEPYLLDRMGDEADGRVGGKPARIDRIITGIRVAGDVPAQEGKNRYARGSRVRGDAGEPPHVDRTARLLPHLPCERGDEILARFYPPPGQLPTGLGGLDEENVSN